MKNLKIKLFIDANIFIAGSASPNGGSAFILLACQNGIFQVVTTRLILQEAKKNIAAKLSNKVLAQFYKFIKTISLNIQPPSSTDTQYGNIIDLKDAHVLVAAIESRSDYLITLDRKHFFTNKIRQAKLPIKIASPKDFIQQKQYE